MRCIAYGKRNKVLMSAGWEDSVKPGLLILCSGSCKSCSGQFLGVKSERRFLRGIAIRGQRAYSLNGHT